jgi:hypothetical protein
MKNNKSPGYDEIYLSTLLEQWDQLGCNGYNWVLRQIYIENRIPEDWYKGIIALIYKKGDRKQCRNYRKITLLCQTFKTYERILVNKTTLEIKVKLAEELHEFRKGRAMTDIILRITN